MTHLLPNLQLFIEILNVWVTKPGVEIESENDTVLAYSSEVQIHKGNWKCNSHRSWNRDCMKSLHSEGRKWEFSLWWEENMKSLFES